jgi:rubrerythrin
MSQEPAGVDEDAAITSGTMVFDDEGTALGVVDECGEGRFTVETLAAVEVASNEGRDSVPGQPFGEGYLMWRCEECGEMGELDDGRPPRCPNCGADGDAIAKALED